MSPLFAYVSPDMMLPVASTLAAFVGLVLLYGGIILRFLFAPFRWAMSLFKGPALDSEPMVAPPTNMAEPFNS
jgi:hypothetical protein